MAMVASGLANALIGNINKSTNAGDANNKFYQALCNYVEANAQVFYSWAAFDSEGSPDPQTMIECKIKTSGSISPSGASTPGAALSSFASTLNSNASGWEIIWPPGFSLSPAFVIPTISFTQSMATDQMSAMLHISQEIIDGLKKATPSAGGSHSSYNGTASFVQII